MSSHERDLGSLPNELLASLCRIVGLKAALTSLAVNSKLHSAWQTAVDTLSINMPISKNDVEIISKFVELKKLKLSNIAGGLPPWLIVGLLAPRLPLLTSIHVPSGDEPDRVLSTLLGTEGLRTRLQDLTLFGNFTVYSSDLAAAAELKGLTSLELTADVVECAENAVPDFSGALPSLHTIKLITKVTVGAHVLSQLPGSLQSLTSLVLLAEFDHDDEGGDHKLAAAVSGLVNLQHLNTNYYCHHATLQRLQHLSHLTELMVTSGKKGQEFAILDHLPSLRVLDTDWVVMGDDFLTHPSLTCLGAANLVVGASWCNRVAESCQLKELSLYEHCRDAPLADDDLANLPTLPHLHSFTLCGLLPSDDGKYKHLASFLHRHAPGLHGVSITSDDAFEHCLPRDLLACTSLSLAGGFVSWHTLQVLAMCSLPKLEDLTLRIDCDIDLDSELGWLRQLPALRRLRVSGGAVGDEGVGVIRGWLAGRGVRVNQWYMG